MKTTNQNSFLNEQNSDSSTFPEEFTFHEDPGHGWLEVPYHLLGLFKIKSKVSRYSYINGETVYLEEDCDAPLFIRAYLKYHNRSENDFAYFNKKTSTLHSNKPSFIRFYPHY